MYWKLLPLTTLPDLEINMVIYRKWMAIFVDWSQDLFIKNNPEAFYVHSFFHHTFVFCLSNKKWLEIVSGIKGCLLDLSDLKG